MTRPLRLLAGTLAALALVLLFALPALATTPSAQFDNDFGSGETNIVFSGITDAGGTMTVTTSCDDFAHESAPVPFANPLHVVLLGQPGCTGYGGWTVWVIVRDGSTTVLESPLVYAHQLTITLDMPLPAITGHTFTIDPQVPADYVAPAGLGCRTEFRWGDDRSLIDNVHDETFGSMLFDVSAQNGDCRPWTFTLPWVPYRQYEVDVSLFTVDPDGGTNFFAGVTQRFTASVDGTERRITASNLPIVQVLPSTYAPIVGKPVTYTRYLMGGAQAGTAVWTAYLGHGDHPVTWHQNGGSTFTFTPSTTGDLLVGWDRMSGNYRLGSSYDPPVRYPDHTPPVAAVPATRIGLGTVPATTMPVTVSWSAKDVGWGVKSYQVQRSVDGGAWHSWVTTSSRSRADTLTAGHAYRYRVRAVDKAGNIGSWATGPAIRPGFVADGSTAVIYHGSWTVVADSSARNLSLHAAETSSATASYRFTGRDIAWIAKRDPLHGQAKVYIDGVYVRTVDLAASVDDPARIVFHQHWAASGTHTIRIVVLGTVGRPAVDVDGFGVLR